MENKNENKMKTSDKVRYGIGICCIIGMFTGMASGDILAGLFLGMFGVSLLPAFYDKFLYTKFNANKNNYLHIIIPIILFLLTSVFMPSSETETSTSTENMVNNNIVNETVEDSEKIEKEKLEEEKKQQEFLNSIKFTIDEDDKKLEIIKGNAKKIIIEIEPTSVEEEQIEFISDNKDIAYVREFDTYWASGRKFINVYINGESLGTTKIYAQIKDTEVKSEEISIDVIEEKKQTTTTTTPSTSTVDEPKKETTTKPSTEETTTTPSTPVVEEPKQETVAPSQNTDNSRTVYRTPSGKRYHLDPDCGGKNSYSTTLDKATSAGLTPCQKCAQ